VRHSKINMFQIKHRNKFHVIPLYQPTSEELELVEILKSAFYNKKKVKIATMDSVFFGERSRIIAARTVD